VLFTSRFSYSPTSLRLDTTPNTIVQTSVDKPYTMLRLTPSKIELSSRDLSWHVQRYQQRKDSHLAANHTARPKANAPHLTIGVHVPLSQHQRVGVWPNPSIEAADDELFSNEPVPRNDQAFWDGVVAYAEASPAATDPLYDDREELSAEESSESIASLPDPSLRHSDESDRQYYGDHWRAQLSDYDPSSSLDLSQTGSSTLGRQGTASPKATESSEVDSNEETIQQTHIEGDRPSNTGSRHRRSIFGFRYAGHDGGADGDLSDSFSSELELEGSSDIPRERSELHRPISSSAEMREKSISEQLFPHLFPGFDDTQHRNLESDIETQLNEGFSAISRPWNEPNEESTTPPLPSNRLVGRLRSRSGLLPRSPLHVSHALASSSPKKDSHTPSPSSDGTCLRHARLHTRLPSRPKRYGTRSEGNPVPGSEAPPRPNSSTDGYDLQGEGWGYLPAEDREMEQLNARMDAFHRRNSYAVEVALAEEAIDDYLAQHHSSSSPSTDPESPPRSFTSTPPRRLGLDGSSLPRSSTKRRQTSLNLFPQPPTGEPPTPLPLPPPFSTKRRLVSFDLTSNPLPLPQNPITSPLHGAASSPDPLALPVISPHPPFSSPQSQSRLSSPYSPIYSPSPSPVPAPPPRTPRSTRSIRVYNDALPANSQPQTPVGLSRGGLNAMPWYERGAWTAPVGTRARARGLGGSGIGGSGLGGSGIGGVGGVGVMGGGLRSGSGGGGSPRVRRGRRTSEQENMGEGWGAGGEDEAGE